MSFTCRLCGLLLEQIPENAVPVGPPLKNRPCKLWRIDGHLHDLRQDRPRGVRRGSCNRWHKARAIISPNCAFCQMDAATLKPVTPPTPPVEVTHTHHVKKFGCRLCEMDGSPQLESVAEPTALSCNTTVSLHEVLNVLTELLQQQRELPKPEPIITESEQPESESAMAHAFRNAKK